MKIVIAFDSFKGCMTASEACDASAQGILAAYPEADVVNIPLSDGGEGLVRSIMLTSHDKLQLTSCAAHGPLMKSIKATYAISEDGTTAYMEMAETSGLPLVPKDKRNPLLTTTYGVGDMIADAVNRGCLNIIMGIGGSATNDAGQGMLQSLIEKGFLDERGKTRDERLKACKFTVACDVTNPLCGPNGASYVFGPQKGATAEQVIMLDKRLQDFAKHTVTNGIALPGLENYPGTGAAGGLGYALMAYFNAELHSGIDIILDLLDFDEKIKGADIIITGEGKSDAQTLMGKVPHGVLKRARKQNTPIYLLSGLIEDIDGTLKSHFSLIRSINEGDQRPLETLMKKEVAKENLIRTIQDIFRNQNLLLQSEGK